jgi:hypothetical protein
MAAAFVGVLIATSLGRLPAMAFFFLTVGRPTCVIGMEIIGRFVTSC